MTSRPDTSLSNRPLVARIARYAHKWNHCSWREAYEYAKWRVAYIESHPMGIAA